MDLDQRFDPADLTDENISTILIEFLSISIFQLVLNEAGDAWSRTEDANDAIRCETEILDLTRTIVDQSFKAEMEREGNSLKSQAVKQYMRVTAKEIWEKWERYND